MVFVEQVSEVVVVDFVRAVVQAAVVVVGYSDGSVYEGEWKNDERDGIGILYESDGSKYEGEWSNDKKKGNM